MSPDAIDILNEIKLDLDRASFLEPVSPFEMKLANAVSILISVMLAEGGPAPAEHVGARS